MAHALLPSSVAHHSDMCGPGSHTVDVAPAAVNDVAGRRGIAGPSYTGTARDRTPRAVKARRRCSTGRVGISVLLDTKGSDRCLAALMPADLSWVTFLLAVCCTLSTHNGNGIVGQNTDNATMGCQQLRGYSCLLLEIRQQTDNRCC